MGRYAGVDWASEKHDVLIEDEAGSELFAGRLTASERERLRSPRRFCHCVRRGGATPRARGRLSAAGRRTEAQIPGRRRSRPRRERNYRNQWGSHREHRAPPDARPVAKQLMSSATGRDHSSRHRHQWPTAASRLK
jgi:hypothetical protein